MREEAFIADKIMIQQQGKLWKEFSLIQCASWMFIDSESVTRFSEWLKTGDNDDAWS